MNTALFKDYVELRGMNFSQFAKALGVKKSYICASKNYAHAKNPTVMQILVTVHSISRSSNCICPFRIADGDGTYAVAEFTL